jgi:hypothetical protein
MTRKVGTWAVLAILTGCIGEAEREGTQAEARAVKSLRCGQTASSGFWAYGLGAFAGASRQDVYELRATPGQLVRLDLQADYDRAFGVGVWVTDARSGELLTMVEGWADRATVQFDAVPAGLHRIAVEPMAVWVRDRGVDRGVTGDYSLRASCDCGVGCPCNAGGVDGVCVDVGECGGAATPGLCPGSAAIQCCTSPRTTELEAAAPTPGSCPGAWRCGCSHYAAGDGCDCDCGAPDPDCVATPEPAFGCADEFCCPDGFCAVGGHCEW